MKWIIVVRKQTDMNFINWALNLWAAVPTVCLIEHPHNTRTLSEINWHHHLFLYFLHQTLLFITIIGSFYGKQKKAKKRMRWRKSFIFIIYFTDPTVEHLRAEVKRIFKHDGHFLWTKNCTQCLWKSFYDN
jgi:hypothetical protein